jgi:hypothetical protein
MRRWTLQSMRSKVEDVIAAPISRPDSGRPGRPLEQIEKHRHLLLRHVERLQALLGQIGEGD